MLMKTLMATKLNSGQTVSSEKPAARPQGNKSLPVNPQKPYPPPGVPETGPDITPMMADLLARFDGVARWGLNE